ncbi:uncharacterized protein LOC130621336 [Hydractinia symbiolongicarpus]|uniref:uncharacterized protein LOC130621336 n=1 Tax=Hydractinia symbiolongicarpus TaxID=13093 RepID=UPI00254CE50E|nr:uncharacterized protein LOC130621336 [Hydractinia symbiolongicarpus]
MGPANSAVVGCMKNTRKLEKWRKNICTEHNSQPLTKGTCASCQPPPYRLFCFPSTNRYLANRLEWVRRVKREKDDKSSWSPRMVFREPVPRRDLNRQHQPRPKKAKKRTLSPGTSDQSSQGDHQYCRQENTEPCLSCFDKQEKSQLYMGANKKGQKMVFFTGEFLLTLMRLRLVLLNEDLADQFNISLATCSNIFTTWVRILSIVLGNCLVNWLPREAVRDHLPNIYKKMGHYKLRCIIDCTEVFIERPKSLELQAQTWSDYKSHNTIKFLIGISPAGFITFLSDCYGGRTSDKCICEDSGFFDALERDNEIMADRGFQIKEDLLLRFCSLSIQPGARIKAQMTTEECKRIKNVANLRIHIERAINRMKTFRILKYVLSITML